MRIIRLMKILGYQADQQGMCYGIAYTAVQSALRGNFDAYLKRSTAIQTFSVEDRKNLKKIAKEWHAGNAKDILIQTVNGISFEELLGYSDAISMYFGLDTYENEPEMEKNLASFIGSQNFNKAAELFNWQGNTNQSEEKYQVSASKRMIVNIKSVEKLEEFLQQENPGNKNCALTISIPGHVMALLCVDGYWYLVDHDDIISAEVDDLRKICTRIQAYETIMEITSYQDHAPEFGCSYSNVNFNDFTNQNDFHKGLYLALREGMDKSVDAFMKKLSELKKSKFLNLWGVKYILQMVDKHGVPGLCAALQLGHAGAVSAFIKGLKELNLNSGTIKEILLAQNEYGIPGLCAALQLGHAGAISAFIKGLEELNLDLAVAKEIVWAKDRYGVPGLYSALLIGHTGAVSAFIKGLEELQFNFVPADVADILLAEDKLGVPGLYSALQQGHAGAISAFMQGLKEFDLSSVAVREIVLAKDEHGVPGLCAALQLGNADAVSAFIKGLKELNLESDVAKEILLAKDRYGVPGLCAALQAGHADAVSAFQEGLKELEVGFLVMEEIMNAQKNNSPKLLFISTERSCYENKHTVNTACTYS